MRTSVWYYLKILSKGLILYFTFVLCVKPVNSPCLSETCDHTEIYTKKNKRPVCGLFFIDMHHSYESLRVCGFVRVPELSPPDHHLYRPLKQATGACVQRETGR